MARTLLQEMVEATPYESLPANWSSFDLKSFSRQKQLWDYQQVAVASKKKTPREGRQSRDAISGGAIRSMVACQRFLSSLAATQQESLWLTA